METTLLSLPLHNLRIIQRLRVYVLDRKSSGYVLRWQFGSLF